MKKISRTDNQIVRIMQEANKNAIAALSNWHSVSEASMHVCRKHFYDMGIDDIERLRD
jgi:hypothetical protein